MAYFKYLGKNIYYDVSGQGEPLIILNGIMMSTKSWESFKDEFSKHFQFIRVDFLDQGQSDAYEAPYTQDIQVELLKSLINHLNLEKVNLVGISYGGEVALGFACKYQEYISKLILFNTVAYTDEELTKTGRLWNEQASKRNYLEYYNLTIPIIYSKKFIDENQEWMKKREVLLLNGPFSDDNFLDRMIRLTTSAESYDVRSKLKNLNIPVLIIGATDDVLTPIAHQEYLYKEIPNSRLIVLPNVGHASMYEVPEIFVSLILGYTLLEKIKYTI
jgi:pimeloyl-ACP methyl ester carboxylesterase